MSADAPVSASSIADEAFHKPAQAVVTGDFAPGEKALEEHHDIAARIAARDAQGADGAMRLHIRSAIESAVPHRMPDGRKGET